MCNYTEMFTLKGMSQFRSDAVAEQECLMWRNGSRHVCTCSILIMWTVIHLHCTLSFCLQ